MLDRRHLLKGTLGTLGAAVGAFAVKCGIGLPEAERGVQGQQVGAMTFSVTSWCEEFVAETIANLSPPPMGANATLSAMPFSGANWPADTHWEEVTGPDPDTYAYIHLDEAENASVFPPGMQMPDEFTRLWGVPRALFPEYDPANGVVPLPMFRWSHSGDDDLALLRASYQHALGQRHPDRPLDGNHLSIRFMPSGLIPIKPYLDGLEVQGVNESYSGPNGWVVQLVTDKDGKVVMWGDSPRYRLVTGNVQHWVDGKQVRPGDYTAPLLP